MPHAHYGMFVKWKKKIASEQICNPDFCAIYFTKGTNNFVYETLILVSISYVLEGCHTELRKQMDCYLPDVLGTVLRRRENFVVWSPKFHVIKQILLTDMGSPCNENGEYKNCQKNNRMDAI